MAETCITGVKTIIYRFHPQKNGGEGYYELITTSGEFLGNVSPAELYAELREFQEQGYVLRF